MKWQREFIHRRLPAHRQEPVNNVGEVVCPPEVTVVGEHWAPAPARDAHWAAEVAKQPQHMRDI